MKILNLDEVVKYFYMAGVSHMQPVNFRGNLHTVTGKAINTLSKQIEDFYINLRPDDSIVFKTGDFVKVI